MDHQLIKKVANFGKKRKKLIVILAILGVSGYSAIRVYNSPSITRKRIRVLSFFKTLISISENFGETAELIGVISRDLRVFLESDCDEIPKSLKKVVKLVNSKEFNDVVVRVTEGVTRGVVRGIRAESNGSNSTFYDRFIDTLLSEGGSGFVSVVAGSFARNLVEALCCDDGTGPRLRGKVDEDSNDNNGGGTAWVDVACSERGREVIGEVVQKFVGTAVAVYLERTMGVNTYDELFAGMTNPRHEKGVRELLVALCNGSIETLVKTSHQVMTKKGEDDSGNLARFVVKRSNSEVGSKTYYSEIDDASNVITVKQNGPGSSLGLEEDRKSSSGEGWVSTVSSTLAVPSNRKLVLDVTGRVTFETVRSFLEFLLGKIFANAKRNFGAVNDTIIETGRRVMRYVTAKSSVVASICLSLCLHVLGGHWALLPA
ncbi:hypothetical protein vseg_015720 [Gypsophila vaccaria]